ncbi:MAG TPA: hypothetical protein VK824_05535 [Planctomycetota bacterium]|nr:hypothetical protein [Planctomycetota bacterium]
MLALLLAMALPACTCPELRERWDSPEETLAQWQARLCRDDVKGEYGCFATSYQKAFHGFENYFAARGALLAQRPAAAWVLQHADLSEHSSPTEYAEDGSHARIVLDAHGESLQIVFECEAWVTVTYADGSTASVRQLHPPAALLGAGQGRQWLAFDRPPVPDESRLPDVRALRVECRWLIADLAGLDPARPAPATALACQPARARDPAVASRTMPTPTLTSRNAP